MSKIKYELLQKLLKLFISNADLTENDDRTLFATLGIIGKNNISDRVE